MSSIWATLLSFFYFLWYLHYFGLHIVFWKVRQYIHHLGSTFCLRLPPQNLVALIYSPYEQCMQQYLIWERIVCDRHRIMTTKIWVQYSYKIEKCENVICLNGLGDKQLFLSFVFVCQLKSVSLQHTMHHCKKISCNVLKLAIPQTVVATLESVIK